MSGFQKKFGWIWIASALLSSTALADSVSTLRRDLSQVQLPSTTGEMKMSQFRSGAGLTCELARKNLPQGHDSAPVVSSTADQLGSRAL